jgi:hypothetical protein
MNQQPTPVSPVKDDRNDSGADESRPAESHQHQSAGGGHRSGSRGAGTFENSDGKSEPQQGPKG